MIRPLARMLGAWRLGAVWFFCCFAMVIAQEAQPAVAGKMLSGWDLTSVKGGTQVLNQVPHMPALKFGKDEPAEVDGGLQFNNGAQLNLALRPGTISGFLDGRTPFEISMSLTPLQPPSGYDGGLFDGGPATLRLMLNHSMRIGIGVNQGKGKKTAAFSGKTILEFNKPYELLVQFTGENVTLFINGKFDGSVRATIPAIEREVIILIGSGWGRDYYYNGVIKSLAIRALAVPGTSVTSGADPAIP